jgi:urate oxidase
VDTGAMLSWNRYGKASVRLVKVVRGAAAHDLVDLTIDVQLEGAFESVYAGDNRACLPTDTMKNTVYALARQPFDSMEEFALRLAEHFAGKPAVTSARISATQAPWTRLDVEGRPHPHAFARDGGERWTAVVARDADGARVISGLTDLVVLKSRDSAFAGFPRDEYTTLPDTTDRIFATSITATWTYQSPNVDFGARELVRSALLETFATHVSQSVQHTLSAMGAAALAACPDVVDITLTLPNRHHLLVDLRPFGLDNPNEIFVATEQPYGLIEATIRR